MTRLNTTVTTFNASEKSQTQAIKKLRSIVSGFKKQSIKAPVSEDIPEKKYIHVPTEAAAGFLRTATPHHMKIANEII